MQLQRTGLDVDAAVNQLLTSEGDDDDGSAPMEASSSMEHHLFSGE